MSHLVHLAAPPIRVANVIRQRCAWCGALIDEHDLANIAVPEGEDLGLVDEDGNPTARWDGLVAVEQHDGWPLGMTAKWDVSSPADGKIPMDSCMSLDPVATR